MNHFINLIVTSNRMNYIFDDNISEHLIKFIERNSDIFIRFHQFMQIMKREEYVDILVPIETSYAIGAEEGFVEISIIQDDFIGVVVGELMCETYIDYEENLKRRLYEEIGLKYYDYLPDEKTSFSVKDLFKQIFGVVVDEDVRCLTSAISAL